MRLTQKLLSEREVFERLPSEMELNGAQIQRRFDRTFGLRLRDRKSLWCQENTIILKRVRSSGIKERIIFL